VGYAHVCALEQGVAKCWGNKSLWPSTPPKNSRFQKLTLGILSVCGYTSTEINCWGMNATVRPRWKESLGDSTPKNLTGILKATVTDKFGCALGSSWRFALLGPNNVKRLEDHFAKLSGNKITDISANDEALCALSGAQVDCFDVRTESPFGFNILEPTDFIDLGAFGLCGGNAEGLRLLHFCWMAIGTRCSTSTVENSWYSDIEKKSSLPNLNRLRFSKFEIAILYAWHSYGLLACQGPASSSPVFHFPSIRF